MFFVIKASDVFKQFFGDFFMKKIILILFISILISTKAYSGAQIVLIHKRSFDQGGYTYHVFDVYDGMIYRGIRITYTGSNGEGGLFRNIYYWKKQFDNSNVFENVFANIDIELIVKSNYLTLKKNENYKRDFNADVFNYNGTILSQTVFDSYLAEHNIYNLNLPIGIYFINLYNKNERKVFKFIQN